MTKNNLNDIGTVLLTTFVETGDGSLSPFMLNKNYYGRIYPRRRLTFLMLSAGDRSGFVYTLYCFQGDRER